MGKTAKSKKVKSRTTGPARLRMRESAQAGDRARGIDRTIALLEALLKRRAPIRIGELARLIGAPRSTTYEIVRILNATGILEPVGDDNQVYFGRAVHFFGHAYEEANSLYRRAGPVLDRLAAETGETTQLCALKGNKYVVVEARDGGRLFRITMDVGVAVPLPWTASGRLLLDHMTAKEIRDFVPAADFRLPNGAAFDVQAFINEVTTARRVGYAMTTGLADRFTWCLAAPIRDAGGRTAATLCFMVPVDTTKERRQELLDRLVGEARALSGLDAGGAGEGRGNAFFGASLVFRQTDGGSAMAAKRELIEPHKGDKRYVRRNKAGRFKESDDVGRSLAQDRRSAAKTKVKSGYGDRGDQKRA